MERSNSKLTKKYFLESGLENLGNGPLKVTMSEGNGWITYNNDDIILAEGQVIELDASPNKILISPYENDTRIVFKVEVSTSADKTYQPQVGLKVVVNGILNLLN